MDIRIIKVPYDCGYKERRQGLGPDRFLSHGIDKILGSDGHRVKLARIESQSDFTIEIMDAFEIGGGAANHYGATGGISQELMLKAIALVKDHIPVKGCGLASYDPSFDRDDRFVEAGIQSVRKIFSPD